MENPTPTFLLDEAKLFTFQYQITVIPCDGVKIPVIDSVKDKRGVLRSMEELEDWFGPNGSKRAQTQLLAALLDSPTPKFALDLDKYGVIMFQKKILPRCSDQLQAAINTTMRTKTPEIGLHFMFNYSLSDFPEGIKTRKYWQGRDDHNEISLMGTGYYLCERGPGYDPINGPECIVTLSKRLIEELIRLLQKFEAETAAIKELCNNPNRLEQYYIKNQNRNNLVKWLGSYLHKNGVPKYLIIDLFDYLMELVGGDEERESRYQVIDETCDRKAETKDVAGKDKLMSAIDNNKGLFIEINRQFAMLGYQKFFDKPGAGGFSSRHKGKGTENQAEKEKEDEIKPTEKFEYLQFYQDREVFAEAVSIAGIPQFAMVNMNDRSQITLVKEIRVPDKISDEGDVLSEWVYMPLEDYSYINKQYAFDSEEDFFNLIQFVQNKEICNIDSLYWLVKGIWSKYIDAEDTHLSICAADTIFSYFQDVIGLTHYLFFVGDNDSGKSNNLVVFHYLGYRNMMSLGISAANIYGFLGSGEEGIGTICEDEANNIEEDRDKMDLAKSGYMKGFPVVKTSISDNGQRTQRKYNTFCLKLYSAEKAPDSIKGKGLNQRLVKIKCIAGNPELDIAEVVNPAGDPELESLLKELHRVRNMLLCYRMTHRNDRILNIDINLRNREKQLFKPLLRLFQNTKTIEELSKVISNFVNERRMIKADSLHAFLIGLVDDMIKDLVYDDIGIAGAEKLRLKTSEIWAKVQSNTHGLTLPGRPLSYECVEFGIISQKQITSILEDVFKAKVKSVNSERYVIFERAHLNKVLTAYDVHEVTVKTSAKASASEREDSTDSTDSGKVYPPSDDEPNKKSKSQDTQTQNNSEKEDIK